MNERIQEFKIECLEWNEEDQVWQVNAEKFAELIVAEFSKQVQIEGRFGLEREQTLIRLCCENAKKHFGV